jgi:type II secretory pathway pseudopilin PulG
MIVKIKNNQLGNSIAEIIIALALLAILIATVGAVLLFGLESAARGRQYLQAQMLAREGVESVRSVYIEASSSPSYIQSAVINDNGHWSLAGEGSSEQLGEFSRQINFSPVYRDQDTNELSAESDPNSYLDTRSRRVRVDIGWTRNNGQTDSYSLESIINSWE